MPRRKKSGSTEPKTRSRNGCWPCKQRKIKCGEERPNCENCGKNGETCDYSIRLNWEGRTKRKGASEQEMPGSTTFSSIRFNPGNETKRISQKKDGCSAPPQQLGPPGLNERATIGNSLARAGFDDSHSKSQGSQITDNYFRTVSPPRSTDVAAYRDPLSTAQLSKLREQSTAQYPSPADSSVGRPFSPMSSNSSNQNHTLQLSNPEMPPPHQSSPSVASNVSKFTGNPRDGAPLCPRSKRMRLNPYIDAPDASQQYPIYHHTSYAPALNPTGAHRTPQLSQHPSFSPSNGYSRVPLTPAASVSSEENPRSISRLSTQTPQDSGDRRMSVQSLLSEGSPVDYGSDAAFPGHLSITSSNSYQKTRYGVDRGFPDLDLPKNDDKMALNGETPELSTNTIVEGGLDGNGFYSEFGFGINAASDTRDQAAYYARPVDVTISKSLLPLPKTLLDNPMNLLYFHHFLNHTARILVPHDCSENPFKSILPQMAVQDTNLLHLLLAYSASHRSRLLNHPEPANRIALWMEDVFPALRRALAIPNPKISNSSLATAIMLASLEIISPNTFEVEIPWQQHLNVARQMILARDSTSTVYWKDKVSYFLTRWFAYLDVLGSLSGRKNDQPLFQGNYWATNPGDDSHDFQIDCLLGFTSRCVSILAHIAELAQACDSERIDSACNVRQNWQPSPEIIRKAQALKIDLQEARMHRYQGCPHRRSSHQIDENSYAVELVTTNDAFHWAGLIHLNRRVLGKPSEDPEVQFAVSEIVSALFKVRKGGTAEGCLLFPMFTAGCAAQDQTQRARIMERLKSVEGSGMFQVRKARALMEKVWETGKPWESLVTGEFFG